MISPSPVAAEGVRSAPTRTLRWREGWSDAVEQFVAELALKGYSAYTIRDYRNDVMQLGAYLDITPSELKRRHLTIVDQLLAEEGLALPARRRRLSAYVRFLSFLSEREPEKCFGPAMLHSVEVLSPQDRLLVGLVYFAGLRLPEIAQLEGRDLRMRKGILMSRSGYRILPLHPRLTDLALAMRDSLPMAPYRPLIPGQNGFAVNSRTLHCRFQRLARLADMEGMRPETLRRESAAFLRRQGTPAGLVAAFLGKDRGRPIAPRSGRYIDLTCLRDRLARLPW